MTSTAAARRLCDRIVPPPLPALDHHDVAHWRPVGLADLDAVTAAQKAMDAVDHPDWTTPREDVADELDSSTVDLHRDSMLALDHAGEVVAWGLAELHPGRVGRVQSFLSGGVVPHARGRGIGGRLLDWLTARATQQLAASEEPLPAWVRCGVDERNPTGLALFADRGYTPARYFTSMECVVANAGHAPAVPDGVAIVPYSPDRARDAREARNDAFRDHWGSQPTTPEKWQQLVAGELFRADLSRLALDADGRVLGFALAVVNPEDWELQGFTSSYLAVLGVVRDARGRGIAPALLAAYLAATDRAGLERAVLDVDTENPTGALGLYERAGFVATSRSVEVVREV